MNMDELIKLLQSKIKVCASGINSMSNSVTDRDEAEAVEHLTRALSYLYQIKEKEGN